MLAHAAGAATLDAPPWLLAYGATAIVLLVTVSVRGRALVAAAGAERSGPHTDSDTHELSGATSPPAPVAASTAVGTAPAAHPTAPVPNSAPEPGSDGSRTGVRVVGRVVGVVALATVVVAAFAGPDTSAANLSPSAVLAVWWVGLPLACVVAGDVMRWLDPFGTLALPLARARPTGDVRHGPSWTAAVFLGAFAWWELAYHDARSPRALGWFLVAYTAAAVAGAALWGRRWLRHGEGFGALSSALAWARATALGRDPGSPGADAGTGTETGGDPGHPTGTAADAGRSAGGLVPLVAVWLGAVVFDLFSGTRAWVEIAGESSGWVRTGRGTACLLAAVGLAWLVVAGTIAVARRRAASAGARRRIGRAVALAWLAATAGAFLAHGITLLLVDGQFALALVSDPFDRGWDLFGTALRTVDYSPLSPGVIGAGQLAAAVGGAVWGVLVAARTVAVGDCPAAGARTAFARAVGGGRQPGRRRRAGGRRAGGRSRVTRPRRVGTWCVGASAPPHRPSSGRCTHLGT